MKTKLAAGVVLFLLALPLAAESQPGGKIYRLGAISPCTGVPPGATPAGLALRQALQERGYVEGQNLTIDRDCFQQVEQAPEIIGRFLERKVDLIVTWSTPAAQAARKATSTVPIVFIDHADPVGFGIVASLARPGRNATGVSSVAVELTAKRLELLKEVVPRATRVVGLANPTGPATAGQLRDLDDAARALGMTLRVLKASTPPEIDEAFLQIARERPDGAFIVGDTMFYRERARIAGLAARVRLPAVYTHTDYALAGGLLAYSPDLPDMGRRAVSYVDRILKGAKPADLPVEQPMKFDLVINMRTAKGLGLTIPPSLLLRADRVIE